MYGQRMAVMEWQCITTEILIFTKCSVFYRVFFLRHSANKSLSSAVYDKVLLSVTTTFTESSSLDTRKHLTRSTLGKGPSSAIYS
jgi:BarA-like signal transduction histidine kinase